MNPSHKELLQWYATACINRAPDRDKLRAQILTRMRIADPVDCVDCGTQVPKGQGIGKSGDDWPDKSKSRPITITPLCMACLAKRFS